MLSVTVSDNKQSVRHRDRQTGRADRAGKQTHRQTNRPQTDVQTVIQTDTQTDRPTANQSTRQVERGDRQTYTYRQSGRRQTDLDRQTDRPNTYRIDAAFDATYLGSVAAL